MSRSCDHGITAKQLGLWTQKIDFNAQKIDNSLLNIYRIFIATFQIIDKLGKARFLQKTFLLANITVKVVLKMHFLIFGNINIQFAKKELTWKSYTAKKALPITQKVEFINKK